QGAQPAAPYPNLSSVAPSAKLSTAINLTRVEASFFCKAPATPDIFTLSLHDALPISERVDPRAAAGGEARDPRCRRARLGRRVRSEEHTSELQSLTNLACRLLLEKKTKCLQKNVIKNIPHF